MTKKQRRQLLRLYKGYVELRGLTQYWKDEARGSLHRATLELRDLDQVISQIKKQLANGR